MNNLNFTYRTGWIFIGVLAWELLFWGIGYALLVILGYINGATKGDYVEFLHPGMFWLLLLLLPLGAALFYNLSRNNAYATQVSPRLQEKLLKPVSSLNLFVKYFFFRNAFVFLVFAMAQPVYGSRKVSGTIDSLELAIALDISNSMNVKDIDPELSRLEIAKRAINQLLNSLHGEKIGLTLFAGSAFVQLPLTSDYNAAKLFLSDIETNMISEQGTNIRQALETSVDMFSEEKCSKGIILITDGENHEENPSEILAQIREKKIQLCILGLGTASGGPVPKNPYRPELGYKTNSFGSTVVSHINPKFINDLASRSGGYSLISSDPFPNLSRLMSNINQMKRTKLEDLEFTVKESRYQYPLAAAVFFLLLYLVWSGRSFQLIDKIAGKT